MKKLFTNCHTHKPKNGPNKLEAEYMLLLENGKICGEIEWYGFERIKLKLANNTYYTPDFVVLRSSGEIEVIETKGFWRDDARIKIKVAAEQYPFFQFKAARKIKGKWDIELF